jgi:hypothetical protein
MAEIRRNGEGVSENLLLTGNAMVYIDLDGATMEEMNVKDMWEERFFFAAVFGEETAMKESVVLVDVNDPYVSLVGEELLLQMEAHLVPGNGICRASLKS